MAYEDLRDNDPEALDRAEEEGVFDDDGDVSDDK